MGEATIRADFGQNCVSPQQVDSRLSKRSQPAKFAAISSRINGFPMKLRNAPNAPGLSPFAEADQGLYSAETKRTQSSRHFQTVNERVTVRSSRPFDDLLQKTREATAGEPQITQIAQIELLPTAGLQPVG